MQSNDDLLRKLYEGMELEFQQLAKHFTFVERSVFTLQIDRYARPQLCIPDIDLYVNRCFSNRGWNCQLHSSNFTRMLKCYQLEVALILQNSNENRNGEQYDLGTTGLYVCLASIVGLI